MNEAYKQLLSITDTTDSFSHYGIPGMKWGTRKASKSVSVSRKQKNQIKRQAKVDKKKQAATKSASKLYRNRSLFTDAELKAATERLSIERNILDLKASRLSRGRQIVQDISSIHQSVNKVLPTDKN